MMRFALLLPLSLALPAQSTGDSAWKMACAGSEGRAESDAKVLRGMGDQAARHSLGSSIEWATESPRHPWR